MTPITDPTALADQLKAAADQVRHGIEHLGAVGDVRLTRTAKPTPFVASQLAIVRDAVLGRTGRVCPHLLNGPRVVLAAAWNPGVLVCTACVDLMWPDHTEDATCDRCRQLVTTLHPTVATFGCLILAYGLCETCTRTERDQYQPTRQRNHPGPRRPNTRNRHPRARRR